MEEPNPLTKKKRNVVVVGLKLGPGCRELLTWTLAKFAAPGDHVIALHIAMQPHSPSSSSVVRLQPDAHRKVKSIFNSVIGVYDGFCSAKQIDLQLKVISSASSLRRTLINEVKRYNASRLILGETGTELPTNDSSFDLAKYCSKHLPCTCLVLVTQHGKVIYEQAGASTLGDKVKGQNPTSKQLMRGKTGGLQHPFDLKKKLEFWEHDDFNRKYCSRCQSNRSLGLSYHVLHPYKYVPPQVHGFQMCNVELEKLSPMPSSKAKHRVLFSNGFSTSTPVLNCTFVSGPLEGHSVVEKYCNLPQSKQCMQKCVAMPSDSKPCLQKCTTMPSPGWPLVKTGWNSAKPCLPTCAAVEQNVLIEASSPCELLQSSLKEATLKTTNDTQRGSDGKCASSTIPQGWPLLHQSMAESKLEIHHADARRMSVVEWVLQLPERPKQLLEQDLGPLTHNSSSCSAIENGQICDNISDTQVKQQEAKKFHSTGVETTLSRKCYQICRSKTCVVFQIADLETATNNFSKDNLIGKGGCSRVYRGVLADGHVVAVKCLDISPASDSENEFLTELEIVSGLQHPHIIDLLGYCIDNKQRYLLVYSFASEGSLEQKLHHSDDDTVLLWTARYKIAIGIGEALDYLHNSVQPVIHRDVKSSNILLQSDLSPQLTDFGLSKWVPTSSTVITCNDVVGTFGYIAPEYFMFGKVSHKTDVYSFGVVLLELVSGKHPIENVRPQGQGNLVLWARPLLKDEPIYGELVDQRLGKEYDEDQLRNMLDAASLCLQQSPHSRPSMSRILKVLRGEQVGLEMRQDSMCRGSDDCYIIPVHGDHDIRRHLTLALYGVDDDMSSQAGLDTSTCDSNPNKLIEEYLRRRYSRSSSFD